MNLGGIVDISLVDVPKKSVTTVFTSGCNLDCSFCHNSSLISGKEGRILLIKEVFEKIMSYNSLVDGVCITGGEPTIQDDIVDLVSLLRKNNIYVNLNTNGLRPDVIEELIEVGLNSIWLDVKTYPEDYPRIVRKNISPTYIKGCLVKIFDLCSNTDTELMVRTTFVSGLMTTREILGIYSFLDEVNFTGCWTIQKFVQSPGVRKPNDFKSGTKEVKEELIFALNSLKKNNKFKIEFNW